MEIINTLLEAFQISFVAYASTKGPVAVREDGQVKSDRAQEMPDSCRMPCWESAETFLCILFMTLNQKPYL